MDKDKLKKWIAKKLKEATRLHKEAEAARTASEYTDTAALEQSCHNEGVIIILGQLSRYVDGTR